MNSVDESLAEIISSDSAKYRCSMWTTASTMSPTTLSPPRQSLTLSPSHSHTSLHSTSSFHSALATPDLDPPSPKSPSTVTSTPKSNSPPTLASSKMARTDSGYSDGTSARASRRSTSSTSSSRRRRGSPRSSITSSRPLNARQPARRASTAPTSSTTSRPQPRHLSTSTTTSLTTTPRHPLPFPFPPFPTDLSTPPSEPTQPPLPPLPRTITHFLTPETRRQEYAAIDASTRGLRGLLTRLLPACILPSDFRRRKFHDEDDAASDGGSVRRYRIWVPEDEDGEGEKPVVRKSRAWMAFGRS